MFRELNYQGAIFVHFEPIYNPSFQLCKHLDQFFSVASLVDLHKATELQSMYMYYEQ